MKRLAVFTLLAATAGGASADPLPLPLPTGYAPTAPRVPAPVVRGGHVLPAELLATPTPAAVQPAAFRPGPTLAARDVGRGGNAWCTDCAPAVRHPLPPAPAAGACVGGACAPAARGHSGDCWQQFKDWLCFRQTPVHLGCTPTPRMPPLYTYFPNTTERAGCTTGNCGPTGCAPGHPRLGGGFVGAGRTCVDCPQPGETVTPGYRLAWPSREAHPAVPAVPPAEVSAVQPTGFRLPPHPQARTAPR